MNIAHIIAALESAGSGGTNTLYSSGLTGGNLGELTDGSKDKVYVDLVRTCRNFAPIASPLSYPEQGIVSIATSGAGSGWPNQDFVAVLLTNSVPADYGTYQCTFTGQATVTCVGTGIASTIVQYNYNSGANITSFGIICAGDIILQFTGLSTGFGQLSIFRPGYDIRTFTGTYTNEFLAQINRSKVLRFTDWLEIDNSTDSNWANQGAFAYGKLRTGRSIASAAQLAVTMNKPAWMQLPHSANNGYITNWLSAIDTSLPSTLTAYIEYSNTTWDTTKDQYALSYLGAQTATNFFAGATGATKVAAAQRISNSVQIQVGAPHNRTVGQIVAVFGITGITSGYYAITQVLSTKAFAFAQTGSDFTATITASAFVIANGDNALVQPRTYDIADLTPEIVRQRFVLQVTRSLWTSAQSLSTASRMKFVYSHPPGQEANLPGLLVWAVNQWGTLNSWLYGVATDGLLSLSDPLNCTSANVVISQLTTSFSTVTLNMARLANACATRGIKPMLSRWGVDTHVTPIPLVAAAVQAAHESTDMGALLISLMTAWRDYNGDLAVFYRLGASFSFGTDGSNSWALNEANIADLTQNKYLGYRNATGLSVVPIGESGVTTGTISVPALFPLGVFSTTQAGNGILDVAMPSTPEITIQVYAPTNGNYTLSVYAAQHLATTATMTVNIDATTLITALSLTGVSFNVTTTTAPLAYTTTIALTAGMHLVKVSFPSRGSTVGISQITFN